MNKFSINSFRSVRDGVFSRSEELDWQEIITLFSDHTVAEAKDHLKLFNATRFKELDVVLKDGHGYLSDRECGDYLVRRTKNNALEVEMLILDYDGTLTISEAKKQFQDYEHFGYTSYGHLQKAGVHKFRLIFPLVSPIPAHTVRNNDGQIVDQGEYYDLSEAIMAFAPGTDPAILKPTQPYYVPSAPEERIHLAERWHNAGCVLDWTVWKRNASFDIDPSTAYVPKKADGRPNRMLDPEQEFRVKGRLVKAKDVKGRLSNVACPFHGDTKGSEFLVKYPDSGVICFHCKLCKTFTLPPEQIVPKIAYEDLPDTGKAAHHVSDFLDIDSEAWDHEDRARIGKFLDVTKKKVLADKGNDPTHPNELHYKSHILYLPEGAGKSQLAFSFLSDPPHEYLGKPFRHQIIFACKSWKQVIEQHASFVPKLKSIGRTAHIAWSFEGSIYRKFKVKVKRAPAKAFRIGKILEPQTIAEILKANPKYDPRFVNLAWNILGEGRPKMARLARPDVVQQYEGHLDDDADEELNWVLTGKQREKVDTLSEPEFFVEPEDDSVGGEADFFDEIEAGNPPAMIFTTFAQLRLLKVKKDSIPLNWIIWIDDPDIDELIDIQRTEEEAKDNDESITVINGTHYKKRPEHATLGLTFARHRSIYTTTESLTVRFLEYTFTQRNERYVLHGDRHQITGGKVTILGTKFVQKRYDAVIPLLANRLKMTLIADGMPAQFNHSTNKGRNDLNKLHLLVELSQPHPFQVKTVCDALGISFDVHRHEISNILMLDKFHQAVGRNSGYRTQGFECVVLVDANKHRRLKAACKYAFDEKNSILIDRIGGMNRKETRTADSATDFVKQIEYFLNHMHEYVSDLRKAKADIRAVITRIDDDEKKYLYVARLLMALTSYSTVRYDLGEGDVPKNPLSQTYWKVGLSVLNEYVPEDHRERVIGVYTKQLVITSEIGGAGD